MKKITRRSFLAAAGVSAAALALTACGGSSNSAAASTSTAASSTAASAAGDATAAANDPKVTLVYAEVNPLDTIVGQTATHFKEKVEELPGRVEQVGRADAAGQRPSAAPEEERRGGAGGEAEAADVHAGVGQSVCDAVPEGILPQLAQKGSSAAQRRIGQRQRGGTAAHPGPERLRRRERGRAFQLKPRLAETI